MSSTVAAEMYFLPRSEAVGPARSVDLRIPRVDAESPVATGVSIADARERVDLGLHESGFELVRNPSAVADFYDCDQVMEVYYEECKALAKRLTGAHT